MKKLLILTAILLGTSSAFANCESPESQAEINGCAAEKLDLAEKNFKKAIADIKTQTAKADRPESVMMLDAISHLEGTAVMHFSAVCVINAESLGGSLAPTEVAGCAEEKINDLSANIKAKVAELLKN